MEYNIKDINKYVKQYKKKNYKYFNDFIKNEKELYFFIKRNNLLYDFKYKIFGNSFSSNQTIYSFNNGFKLILGMISSDKVDSINKDIILRNEPNIEEFEYKELCVDKDYYFTDIMLRYFIGTYEDLYEIELCTIYDSGLKKDCNVIYDMYSGNLSKIKIDKYKYWSAIRNYDWVFDFEYNK